ncbi:uncharacterized protein LOC144686850 isoform X1 [Cetorhinus maximus]
MFSFQIFGICSFAYILETHRIYSSQMVPCTAKFDEELREESIVVIKGKLTDDPLRFDVNFQKGDHPDADILFHFNPRFKEELEKVIFNSRGPDGWGFQGEKYEKIASRTSPFKLVFMVWNNSFQLLKEQNETSKAKLNYTSRVKIAIYQLLHFILSILENLLVCVMTLDIFHTMPILIHFRHRGMKTCCVLSFLEELLLYSFIVQSTLFSAGLLK